MLYSFIDPGPCQVLKVELKNDAYESQSSRDGIYKLSSTVNGRRSWTKSKSQAIWYVPEYTDWGIGSLEKIGGTLRGIASVANNDVDDPQYIDPSKWKYYSDGAWRQGGNDIIVECIEGI